MSYHCVILLNSNDSQHVPFSRLAMKALPRRCEGLCRNGKRCSITATSDMRDGQGVLVAAPLLAGCARCVFHMQTFVKNHTLNDEDCVVVFVDLETSGLSTVRDRIVEIGAFSLDGVPFKNHYKSYSPSCKGRVRVGAVVRWSELRPKKQKARKTHGFQMQTREFLDLHWKGLFFCIEKG
jgi:hypothetical protein